MKTKCRLLTILLLLFIAINWTYAQTKSAYNLVYINISDIERVSLQSYLSKLYTDLSDQKTIFFLSNRNRPIIATDEKSFESLQASLSNINTTTSDLLMDIEEINKVLSKYDFLDIDNTPGGVGIKHLYKEVTMYFVVDPNYFVQRNLYKYLVSPILDINYSHTGSKYITVNVCFEMNELKKLQKEDPGAFMKNEFNLIKY
jgi:hypothetical protein